MWDEMSQPKAGRGLKQDRISPSFTSCFYSDTQRSWMMPLPTLLSPLMQMGILYANGLIYTSRICPLLCLMGALTHKINHHSIQIIIIKWTHLCNLCLLPETTFSNFFLSLSHPFHKDPSSPWHSTF